MQPTLPAAPARSLSPLCLTLILLLTPALALANDGSFGGAGGSLVPAKQSEVWMASEDITLEQVAARPGKVRVADESGLEWKVTADYLFENLSDKPVTVQMGFPELSCGGDIDCPEKDPYTFHDLKTSVRGKPIAHTVGQFAKDDELAKVWNEHLGRVYLFSVTFAPKEKVAISHVYYHARSSFVEGEPLHYVTRTGALWARPIGHARFTVKLPTPHAYVAFSEEFELVSRKEEVRETPLAKRHPNQWTYVFEMSSWRPKGDLHLLFGNQMERGLSHCPSYYEAVYAYQEALAAQKGGSSAERSERAMTSAAKELFGELSTAQLRQCRNWPYAMHGYTFKDKDLQSYFYQKPFSTHCEMCAPSKPGEHGDEGSPEPRYTRFYHMPNPAYSDALLSEDDMRYVKLVKLAEQQKSKGKKK